MMELIFQGLAGFVVAAAGLYIGKHIGRRQGRVSALEDAADVYWGMADAMTDEASSGAAKAVAIMLQTCANTERVGVNLKTPLAEREEAARDG